VVRRHSSAELLADLAADDFSRNDHAVAAPTLPTYEERRHPDAWWAGIWGFSAKTLRDWFRDEYFAGVLRQPNLVHRYTRDYTTIMISSSLAHVGSRGGGFA